MTPEPLLFEKKYRALAPTRLDLAGGTLDIWPLPLIIREKMNLWKTPLYTVNLAIELFACAEISIQEHPFFEYHLVDEQRNLRLTGRDLDHPELESLLLIRSVLRDYYSLLQNKKITVATSAQAPRGSGLGGSSALMIALMSSLESALGLSPELEALCLRAQNLEAGILGTLAGNQDHYAAAFGSVQALEYSSLGTKRRFLDVPPAWLMEHLVLAYSGVEHFSGFNNWQILEQILTGNQKIISLCKDIALCAEQLASVINKKSITQIATIIDNEWSFRRQLAPQITTPELENFYKIGKQEGALGGKVCGAGGGGVLLLVCAHPEEKKALEKALTTAGAVLLKTQAASSGVTVTVREA